MIPKTDRFVLEKERVSEKEIFSSFFSFCLNEFFFCSTGLYLVIFSRLQRSGVYTVNPTNKSSFEVFCDMKTDGGGWTVTTVSQTV